MLPDVQSTLILYCPLVLLSFLSEKNIFLSIFSYPFNIFTWDFHMKETTHDSSSSSSRKSEEKCPPAGGIKMKIGGFKTGHCYHKPSDAAIQQEPSGVSSGVWLPRLSQDDFDRVVQTTPS